MSSAVPLNSIDTGSYSLYVELVGTLGTAGQRGRTRMPRVFGRWIGRCALALLVSSVVVLSPAPPAEAASQDFFLPCGSHRVSGFRHWGLPSASMRNLHPGSSSCFAVQARVVDTCQRTRTSSRVIGTYARASTEAVSCTVLPNWSVAQGRAERPGGWLLWVGIQR